MIGLRTPLAASLLLLLALTGAPLRAGEREMRTVEEADDVVRHFAAVPQRCIPPRLLHEAVGVAILPRVIKAGILVEGRFGRGVFLTRQPDGCWSNPMFITLEGLGVGGQAGVESTDLVLIFRTPHSVDRVVKGKGKLTLGADFTVAVGPVGREAEVAAGVCWKADVLTYSRTRGFFAGLSLEGAGLRVDREANEAFYGVHRGRPAEIQAREGHEAVEGLRAELARLSTPPAPPPPPAVIVNPQPPVIVVPQPPAYPPPPWRR